MSNFHIGLIDVVLGVWFRLSN